MSLQTTKTELEKIIDGSTLTNDMKDMCKATLKNHAMMSLSQWKELSSERKKTFPAGLELLLNKETEIQG